MSNAQESSQVSAPSSSSSLSTALVALLDSKRKANITRRDLVRAISLFVVADKDGGVDNDASSLNFIEAVESFQKEVVNRLKLVDDVIMGRFNKGSLRSISRSMLQTSVMHAIYEAEPDSASENITADVTELVTDYLENNASDYRADGKAFFLERGKKGATATVWLWGRINEETEKKTIKTLVEKKRVAEAKALERAKAKAAKKAAESGSSEDDSEDEDES